MSRRTVALIAAALLAGGRVLGDPAETAGQRVPLSVPGRDFIGAAGQPYVNYAFADYEIPETALIPPYERRNYYGPLGYHLIDGYNVYSWSERRAEAGTQVGAGSAIGKWGRYDLFQRNLVASESTGRWSAKLIIGDEIRTLFTPLTFYQAGVNGLRLDTQTRRTRFSAIASRYRHPLWVGGESRPRPRDSSLLTGGHAELDIGALTLGATGVDFQVFDSQQEEFSLRGSLESIQGLPRFAIVRFSDDSPLDERHGAAISQVEILVNGERRPDIQPLIVRLDSRNPTFVGVTSRVSGQFVRTSYPDDGTRFADVLYLLRHLDGENVSRNVNLPELVRNVQIVPPGEALRADGFQVVEYFFDLSAERYVRQVAVEALVANDYRIELYGLSEEEPAAAREEARWRIGALEGRRRAAGNVQDLSNMQRVRLEAGAWTGRAVVGVDGRWEALGGRLRWEYARSLEFRQYPDGRPAYRSDRETQGVRQWHGRRSTTKDAAQYVTCEWARPRWAAGAEAFSIGPEFTRKLIGTDAGNLLSGEEITDGFIEDNDDDDRWPDRGPGVRFGHLGANEDDPDGVFPGNDADHDGIPDTNRNGNGLPDYEEPFLLFDSESPDYVYGRDWNHNGVADEREDDLEPDLPYQLDQRGLHVFGKVRGPAGLTLTAGRLDAHGIASGGRNQSSYAGLNLRWEQPGRSSLEWESFVQRVHDDIPNAYRIFEETLSVPTADQSYHAPGSRVYVHQTVTDLLEWRNSIDQQHYAAAEWRPREGVRLAGTLRYAINQQQAGVLADGTDQRHDELRLWSGVAKAEYVWRPAGSWEVTWQGKGLFLRRERQSLPVDLKNEWTLLPIIKAQCRLTPRTRLSLGTQGVPGFPLMRRDRDDGRDTLEEEVRIVEVSNRSSYYGYEISTNLGVRTTRRQYRDTSRSDDEIDVTAAFMRVFLGYQ
ncbi:MAG: hypothetical protein AB1505_05635 [Candidatus Latescibacterota bacterium]